MEEFIGNFIEETEDFINDIPEKIGDFVEDNWKRILIFALIILVCGSLLFALKSDVKTTENQIKSESANAISGTFNEMGDSLAETVDDPAVKFEIKILCLFLGILFLIIIILIIGEAFKPVYDAIDPWQMAGRMSR